MTFLSEILNISKSRIEIFRGHISRQKDVLIDLNVLEVVKVISE
jgi:uncharacterized protein YggU (UPF0235/DUF167 family)